MTREPVLRDTATIRAVSAVSGATRRRRPTITRHRASAVTATRVDPKVMEAARALAVDGRRIVIESPSSVLVVNK
jgi:hypothetical protein